MTFEEWENIPGRAIEVPVGFLDNNRFSGNALIIAINNECEKAYMAGYEQGLEKKPCHTR